MIDFKVLEKLLDLLNSSDAQSIEVTKRWWSTSVRVSKSRDGNSTGPVTYQVAAPAALAGPPAVEVPAPVLAPAAPESRHVEITSPMVGTFYLRPEPGADPFVAVGGRVEKGKVVCIIEAMKIMNPLESEVSGVVVERMIEDSQPVEFGQVLFRVDPNG